MRLRLPRSSGHHQENHLVPAFSKYSMTPLPGLEQAFEQMKLLLRPLEAIMEASVDAEAAYSGINLDTEAARLIEQQQAYQASARILQTARELFQTLMDVV